MEKDTRDSLISNLIVVHTCTPTSTQMREWGVRQKTEIEGRQESRVGRGKRRRRRRRRERGGGGGGRRKQTKCEERMRDGVERG